MLPEPVCDKVVRSLIRELHFDISRTRAQLPLAGGVALRGDVATAGLRFHRAFRSLDFDGARTAANVHVARSGLLEAHVATAARPGEASCDSHGVNCAAAGADARVAMDG